MQLAFLPCTADLDAKSQQQNHFSLRNENISSTRFTTEENYSFITVLERVSVCPSLHHHHQNLLHLPSPTISVGLVYDINSYCVERESEKWEKIDAFCPPIHKEILSLDYLHAYITHETSESKRFSLSFHSSPCKKSMHTPRRK